MKIAMMLVKLVREESGQDLIEYALVASLVALSAVASMSYLGNYFAGIFWAVGVNLASAI